MNTTKALLITLSILSLFALGISLYSLSLTQTQLVNKVDFNNKITELENKISSSQNSTEDNNNPDEETPEIESGSVSITGVSESGSEDVNKCENFYISWTGDNLDEPTCVVTHTNLTNPNGFDLNNSFSEIYNQNKKQGFSVCDLEGEQRFTITCTGLDGEEYSDSTTLNFSEN